MPEVSAGDLEDLASRALGSGSTLAVERAMRTLEQGYEEIRSRHGEDHDDPLRVLSALALLMEHAAIALRDPERAEALGCVASTWTHIMDRRSANGGALEPSAVDAGLRAARVLCIELSKPLLGLSIAVRCHASSSVRQFADDELAAGALLMMVACRRGAGDVDGAVEFVRALEQRLEALSLKSGGAVVGFYDRWCDTLARCGLMDLAAELYRAAVHAEAVSGDVIGDAALARAHRHAKLLQSAGRYSDAVDLLLECCDREQQAGRTSGSGTPQALRAVVMAFAGDSEAQIGAWSSPDRAHPMNIGLLVRQARVHRDQCVNLRQGELFNDIRDSHPRRVASPRAPGVVDNAPHAVAITASAQALLVRSLRLLGQAHEFCLSSFSHSAIASACLDEYADTLDHCMVQWDTSPPPGASNAALAAMFLRSGAQALPMALSTSLRLLSGLSDLGQHEVALETVARLGLDTRELSECSMNPVSSLSFGKSDALTGDAVRNPLQVLGDQHPPDMMQWFAHNPRPGLRFLLELEESHERLARMHHGDGSKVVADALYRVVALSLSAFKAPGWFDSPQERSSPTELTGRAERLVAAHADAYGRGSVRCAEASVLFSLARVVALQRLETAARVPSDYRRAPDASERAELEKLIPGAVEAVLADLQACIDVQVSLYGESHPESLTAMYLRARVLEMGGRSEQAELLYVACIDRMVGETEIERNLRVQCRAQLLNIAQGRHDPAITLARADELLKSLETPGRPRAHAEVPSQLHGPEAEGSSTPPYLLELLAVAHGARLQAFDVLRGRESIDARRACMDLLSVEAAQGKVHPGSLRDHVQRALLYIETCDDAEAGRHLDVLVRLLGCTVGRFRRLRADEARDQMPDDPATDEALHQLLPAAVARAVWRSCCHRLGASHASSLECELMMVLMERLPKVDAALGARLEELARWALRELGEGHRVTQGILDELCDVLRSLRQCEAAPDLYRRWWLQCPPYRRSLSSDPAAWLVRPGASDPLPDGS